MDAILTGGYACNVICNNCYRIIEGADLKLRDGQRAPRITSTSLSRLLASLQSLLERACDCGAARVSANCPCIKWLPACPCQSYWAGPSFNAVGLGMGLLHGTVHEVSLVVHSAGIAPLSGRSGIGISASAFGIPEISVQKFHKNSWREGK